MNFEETIYKRQSIRSYENTLLDKKTMEDIKDFIDNTKVLNQNINWTYDIVSGDMIKTLLNWKAPHYLLLFSEETENYKENIGFIFQQVDLYLQSIGIGTCWLGMISPNKNYQKRHENMKYIIGISFGKPEKELYRQICDFNRKSLKQIADEEDDKLKPIQYAPSAVNSQPWYIIHNPNGSFNIYREKLGIIKRKTIGKWNEIDIGIALAHIYVENSDTFNFFIEENPKILKDYIYEGTFEI